MKITVIVHGDEPGDPDVEVTADPMDLRRDYAQELHDDGMHDASDEAVVRHVYMNNEDAPGLEVQA